MQEDPPVSFKDKNGLWRTAKCDECLHQHLGDYVDIIWNIKTGAMRICRSVHDKCTYSREEGVEYLNCVHFRHSEECPLQKPQIKKNPQKTLKPCSCVLLYDEGKKEFLVTQRAGGLSFPHAWVLPGGHLESGEGIFEGGVRECEEEVGLPHSDEKNKPVKQAHIMVWESINDVKGFARSGALVVFFVTHCEQFEVKIHEREVSAYKWKKMKDDSDEILYDEAGQKGYARGHLAFLKIIRSENPHL